MNDLRQQLSAAVRQFWKTRRQQEKKQGKASGKRDQGSRSAVTGGAQMDGFVELVSGLLVESGIPNATIYRKKSVEVPGFFRPTKEWRKLPRQGDSFKGELSAVIRARYVAGGTRANASWGRSSLYSPIQCAVSSRTCSSDSNT